MVNEEVAPPLKTQLQNILELREWNPPLLIMDPRSEDTCPPLELTPKHTFYDKHLHEGLSLKRVTIVPLLVTDFDHALNAAFSSILERRIIVPPYSPDDFFYELPTNPTHTDRKMKGVDAVIDFYYKTTSMACSPVASVFLHPCMPKWHTILSWVQYERDTGTSSAAFAEGCTLRIRERNRELVLPNDIAEALSDEETEVLRELAARFPYLGTWQVFALSDESETFIKDMGALHGRFTQEVCPTTGYAASFRPTPLTVDARTPQWDIPLDAAATDATEDTRKASLRSGGQPPAPANPKVVINSKIAQVRTITVPSIKTQTSGMRSASSAGAFLEHAWCESVRNDTTVIVFHCGTLERIGIRHRESQTLFLSELIDVHSCKAPAYGALQTGLYIAIFTDAVERARQLADAEAEAEKELNSSSGRDTLGKRRRHDGHEAPSNKRRRIVTRSMARLETPVADIVKRDEDFTDVVLEHCVGRDMMFLTFQIAVYHSPSPASFARQDAALVHGATSLADTPKSKPFNRARQFAPHQYIQFTVTSNIGYGAIGIAHRGKLEVTTSKRVKYSCDAVIKLAFSHDQQERMRYEYSIYNHLSACAVKGVPKAFGLFQDTLPGGPLALVMSFGGATLLRARPATEPFDGLIDVTRLERDAFMRILRDIHRAGVIHNDLRPENLLVKADGQTTIIDFDRATLETRRFARKCERRDFRDLLSGEFARPSGRAPPTPPGVVYSDSETDDSVAEG